MSAIGNYVHYAAENYYKYGIKYRNDAGAAAQYSGDIQHYLYARRRSESSYIKTFNYQAFEKELRKNSITNIQKDQQLVNLDYGQKINQFRSMLIAKATGNTVKQFTDLMNKTEQQLINDKKEFDNLQMDMDMLSGRLQEASTIYSVELEKAHNKYKELNQSRRTSILGNIQQGWNDYSAKTWQETLNGELGNKIEESVQQTAESVLKKDIQSAIESIPNIKTNFNNINDKIVYSTSDKTGSTYAIAATKDEGWKLDFTWKRTNILAGSVQNLYAGDVPFSRFVLNEEGINLGELLTILDSQNKFSTHWMNRHASHLDTSLDSDLKDVIVTEAMIKKYGYWTNGDFVYINRKEGEVYSQNFWNVVTRTNFRMSPNLNGYRLDNTWISPDYPSHKAAYMRVAKMVQDLHMLNLEIVSESVVI